MVHEIFNFIEKGAFDLVAMATHGHDGLSRQVFGSNAEHIAHLVSIPMLLVNRPAGATTEAQANEPRLRFMNAGQHPTIAVVTDGSQHTQQAVLVATNLSQILQAEL